MRKWVAVLAAALVAALTVAACGGSSDSSGSSGGGGGGSGEYVVGYEAPLSGSLSFLSTGNLAGLESYFSKVNEEGGIDGRKIKVTAEDSHAEVSDAVVSFRNLAREGAVAVAGWPISQEVEGVLPSAEQSEVPLIGYGVLTDELTEPPKPFAFSTGVPARTWVGVLSQYVNIDSKKRGIENPTVAIVTTDTAASMQVRDIIAEASGQAGWNLVSSQFIPLTATTANAQMADVAAAEPDYLFLWDATPLLPLIVKGGKAAGINEEKTQFVGSDFANDESIIATLGIDNYHYDQTVLWSGESGDPAVAKMQAVAKKAGHGGELTQSYFTNGWVTGQLIATALEGCGSECDGAAVAEELKKVNIGDADGLAGPDVGFTPEDNQAYTSQRIVHFDQKTKKSSPVTDWLDSTESRITSE